MDTSSDPSTSHAPATTGHVAVTLPKLTLLCVATFGFYLLLWFHRTAENFRPEKPNIRPVLYGIGVLIGFAMPFMIAKFSNYRNTRLAQDTGDYGYVIPKFLLVLGAAVCLLLFIATALPGLGPTLNEGATTETMLIWLLISLGGTLAAVFMLWGIQKPLNLHAAAHPEQYTIKTPSRAYRTGEIICVILGVLYWAAMIWLAFSVR